MWIKNTSLKLFWLLLWVGFVPLAIYAKDIHVSVNGNDHNLGTLSKPLRTVSAAAKLAMPGDEVIVHGGVYREEVRPNHGGTSDTKRITFRAAKGESVEFKGSEVIKNWRREQGDIWSVEIPVSFFGSFNPYSDEITGDWFNDKGRKHHTGAVYLNGDWLVEAAKAEDLQREVYSRPCWHAVVANGRTLIRAQFPGKDPNRELVEINVRQTVFYPAKTGINYISVSGFKLSQAATNWAPPTAEQKAVIGTNWSKGWIIENNEISYSRCAGISLGKYGDEFDNTSANSAEGYVETVKRALLNGWNKQTVGGHIVRNNRIHHCEQVGIVGSLGCAFSTVSDNEIYDIYSDRLFSGAEMGGIKFHGAIDVQITGNHVYRTDHGIWLDWMAQGARVSGNLLHDNRYYDVYFEVDHGPILMDNNLLLSERSLWDMSEGLAIVHNLVRGKVSGGAGEGRETPYFLPHGTDGMQIRNIRGGDARFMDNIILDSAGISAYRKSKLAVVIKGNRHSLKNLMAWSNGKGCGKITTSTLGRAVTPDQIFANPNGTALKVPMKIPMKWKAFLNNIKPTTN